MSRLTTACVRRPAEVLLCNMLQCVRSGDECV